MVREKSGGLAKRKVATQAARRHGLPLLVSCELPYMRSACMGSNRGVGFRAEITPEPILEGDLRVTEKILRPLLQGH